MNPITDPHRFRINNLKQLIRYCKLFCFEKILKLKNVDSTGKTVCLSTRSPTPRSVIEPRIRHHAVLVFVL